MAGFIYVMSNIAMPNIFKIGASSEDPEKARAQLYTNDVPQPFFVEYYAYTENYVEEFNHISQYQELFGGIVSKERGFVKSDLFTKINQIRALRKK